MWPFKRNTQGQDNVPTEIRDYYQAERRERVGMAWLLALGTFLITVIVAVGLFFGGRWTFRKLTHKSTPAPQTAQTTTKQTPSTEQKPTTDQKTQPNTPTTTPTPTPTTTPTPTSNTNLPHTGPDGND